MTKWLNSLQPLAALLLRLTLGTSMAVHGYGKVVPHGALHHFAHYVTTLGLPYWLGYISAFTEFIGGILLILGLFTRFSAALIAVNMLVAFFLIGIHAGFGIYNYILALIAIAVMLVSCGAGAMSLDRKVGIA